MLRGAFLGCALILPALFASAIASAGQPDFGAENFRVVAENAQTPFGHSDDYQSVCHGIARNISPASQVFFPGAVLALLSVGSITHRLC